MKVIRIKITSTPKGEAPEKIREAWIGLELDGAVYESRLIRRPTPNNTSGFITLTDTALSALKGHNREASEWWSNWQSNHPDKDALLFDSGCYTVINPQEGNRAFMSAFKLSGALDELVNYIFKN